MNDPVAANREQWAERLPYHLASDFYDVERFKAGAPTLRSIELDEVGDVAGIALLHLQCHFGLDTLSWARLGARVTGVDFSPPAIEAGRRLARETGLDARFLVSTVDDLPAVLDDEFDVVFTSYGALMWISDIGRWARVIAQFLRPGGRLHVVEFHPLLGGLAPGSEFAMKPFYFGTPGPIRWDGDTDYAEPSHVLEHPSYEWVHRLGDIVSAVIAAGLRLDSLHEHPVITEPVRPYFEQDTDGWWRIPSDPLPLTFSLCATKPEPARRVDDQT